jgi:hypothetical protein
MFVRRGDARLGWVDMKSGERVLERSAALDDFEEFTRRWVVTHNQVRAAAGKPPLRLQLTRLDAPKAPPRDLSANRPGEGVDQKAEEVSATVSDLRRYSDNLVGKRAADEAWKLGAEGEELVAEELAKLGPRWKVLHSVPVGTKGSDIDHVVVGPAGIFTINTKNHSRSRVLVNENYVSVSGHELPYARNARFEAARAGTSISRACGTELKVMGVVAIIAPAVKMVIKAQPKDGKVRIISHESLRGWLTSLPEVFSAGHVDGIYAKARISTTWT